MRAIPFVLLALCLPLPALADMDIVPIGNHVAKLTLPFDTTYDDPNTMETVHVTGSLLVKTSIKYFPISPIKVQTAFTLGKDVTAVGMTSGNAYKMKGKGGIKHVWYPNAPIKGVDHIGIIQGYPTSPIIPGNPITPPSPVRVHFHVDYDPMTGAATTSAIDFPNTPILGACHPVAQVCN